MSDYTDDIVSGIFCQDCGTFIGDDDAGFPRVCGDCAKELRKIGRNVVPTGLGGYQDRGEKIKPQLPKAKCPHCERKFKVVGLLDHIRALHPEKVK